MALSFFHDVALPQIKDCRVKATLRDLGYGLFLKFTMHFSLLNRPLEPISFGHTEEVVGYSANNSVIDILTGCAIRARKSVCQREP